MENVEESVMNNDGTIEIEIDDNKFIVTVILNAVKEGEQYENCGN